MMESSTTAAPTTPIGAARIVPITITATASPPGTRFSNTSVAVSMSRAEPERSSTEPMKMKSGIDTRIGSAATPPYIRIRMLVQAIQAETSSHQPISAKNKAVPPSTNATG